MILFDHHLPAFKTISLRNLTLILGGGNSLNAVTNHLGGRVIFPRVYDPLWSFPKLFDSLVSTPVLTPGLVFGLDVFDYDLWCDAFIRMANIGFKSDNVGFIVLRRLPLRGQTKFQNFLIQHYLDYLRSRQIEDLTILDYELFNEVLAS